MAKRKRPEPGKCVHCLADGLERDWDHVFPKSWYPEPSPTNLYKWQVPSCIPCNRSLGRIEEDFLRRVALGLDPQSPASQSIVATAMRSMDPNAAKNPRDREIRTALRKRILSEMLEGEAIPDHGIYPGLGEKPGTPHDERAAILIPANSFRRITEKLVRGIFYVEDNKFIEPPFAVTFEALDEATGRTISEMMSPVAKVYAREPGVIVRRVLSADDGLSSAFEIELWSQFKTYAWVGQDASADDGDC